MTVDTSPSPSPIATPASDIYSRISTSSTSGRGSLAGWAACPLCPARSAKRFALGRGIAAHLNAVHTPWKPGKAERKRREALRKKTDNLRRKSETRRKRRRAAGADSDADADAVVEPVEDGSDQAIEEMRMEWTPTPKEVEQWGRRVAELAALVEASSQGEGRLNAAPAVGVPSTEDGSRSAKRRKTSSSHAVDQFVGAGKDRTGRSVVSSYRESLPPVLVAAADGNLDGVRALLDEAREGGVNGGGAVALRSLLDQRDRNGSTAEHWAAGGGHLECLKLLHAYRNEYANSGDTAIKDKEEASGQSGGNPSARQRRRDGKSPLHYAARNGRDEVIDYLLRYQLPSSPSAGVDIFTGDGTTPLHLACYGAHLPTVRLLVGRYGADHTLTNDWGCGTSHWVAMSACEDSERVIAVCNFLKWECNVPFHERQRQGHSPVHKAAQKKNRAVIEWLAGGARPAADGERCATLSGAAMSAEEKKESGLADDGGNRPSDIWNCVGGSPDFGAWMRNYCSW